MDLILRILAVLLLATGLLYLALSVWERRDHRTIRTRWPETIRRSNGRVFYGCFRLA